jgi:AhpD family alkylhydroperoxidase
VTLVSLIEPEDADPDVRPTLESGLSQYGVALNTWRALLHRPPIFNAYMPYLRAVVGPGVLAPRIKELSALRVAIANHCRYSASHRTRAARAAGITEDELAALARDDLAGFDEREQIAIEFARELTLRPPTVGFADEPQAVDGGLLARVRASFNEAEIVELTANIGLWNALSRFHRVMGFELDMPPPPASVDEAL